MLHGIKASRQEIWGSGKRLESDADPVKAYRDKIFLTFISLHEDGIGIALLFFMAISSEGALHL